MMPREIPAMARSADPASIIVPAYNEAGSLAGVIEHIRAVLTAAGVRHEIIVVDDASTDQTAAAAAQSGAIVLAHETNRGYGASLKTGIRAARYERIVITDADGTYPVEQIPRLLDELDSADMVVGARTGAKVHVPLVRRPAKWLLGRLAEYVTGCHIPDLNSGLRAFRRQLVQCYLSILPDKFSFTTTITVAMLCDNYRIVHVPIDYHKRAGHSKIVPWDFVGFVTLVLRLSMLFNPLKVLVPVAMGCFGLGTIKLVLDIAFAAMHTHKIAPLLLGQPVVSTTTVIFFLSGLQILLIGMISDGLVRKIGQRMPPDYHSHSLHGPSVARQDNLGSAADKPADDGNQT
jgi:glycosyltransferase involved in cell wall biosynthesis